MRDSPYSCDLLTEGTEVNECLLPPLPLHALLCASQVFSAAGLKSPIAASIITGGVNLLFTIAAAAAMDRCGN